MQVLERLAEHEDTVAGLWRAAREGRLPHALLFEGPAGVGKFTAARRLAAGLLCATGPGPPCLACPPCKRVTSGDWRGNHPDLHLVDPVREAREAPAEERRKTVAIRVNRIVERDDSRETVEDFLHLVAVESGWRIVLVRQAELMVVQAQNALLKTLEEPGRSTLLVLETSRSSDLLTTVRSRCVRVRFGRLSREDSAAILAAEGMAPDRAEGLARWSAGAPGEALRLDREGAPETRAILGAVLDGSLDPLLGARRLWDVEADFPSPTPAAGARARARSALDLALALVADLRRAAAGADPADLAHGDLCGALAPDLSAARAARALARLLDLRATMEANATPELTVERSLLVLSEVAGVPSAPRSV